MCVCVGFVGEAWFHRLVCSSTSTYQLLSALTDDKDDTLSGAQASYVQSGSIAAKYTTCHFVLSIIFNSFDNLICCNSLNF